MHARCWMKRPVRWRAWLRRWPGSWTRTACLWRSRAAWRAWESCSPDASAGRWNIWCPSAYIQPAKYSPVVGAALCVLSESAGVDITAPGVAENLMKEKMGEAHVDG